MNHSSFCRSIIDAHLGGTNIANIFTDAIIQRWLDDNTWVNDSTAPCAHCRHMKEVNGQYSEEKCRQNVQGGGYCYRETLKVFFLPFLHNALLGIYPSLDVLVQIVHHRGPIWDGLNDASILSIVLHELGGTKMRMAREAQDPERKA